MKYTDPTVSAPHSSTVSTKEACQQLCQSDANCLHFTFVMTQPTQCWLQTASAQLQKSSNPSVAGPKTCAQQAEVCSPSFVPGAGFPRATDAMTNAAWSTGFQPVKLQCWPHSPTSADPLPCPYVRAAEDVATGWPGRCMGLTSTQPGQQTCRDSCRAALNCPSWQELSNGECWQGLGENCYRFAAFTPAGAQRLVRGSYRVLMELMKVQVLGLINVFDSLAFADHPDAARHCRDVCLSDIYCEYWQLHNETGCWVEHGTPVPYPLTSSVAVSNSPNAQKFIAGEYIQRDCKPPTPAPTPPQGPGTAPVPTLAPGLAPTLAPTLAPKLPPTLTPTPISTPVPSVPVGGISTPVPSQPTSSPSLAPTLAPTLASTLAPTMAPTLAPTGSAGGSSGRGSGSGRSSSSSNLDSLESGSGDSSSGFPWWAWVLIAMLPILILMLLLLKPQKDPKVKKSQKAGRRQRVQEVQPLVGALESPTHLTPTAPVPTGSGVFSPTSVTPVAALATGSAVLTPAAVATGSVVLSPVAGGASILPAPAQRQQYRSGQATFPKQGALQTVPVGYIR